MFKNLKIQVSKKTLIFLGVFIILLACDLITKHLEEAFAWNFTFIPNLIWVESGHRNSGASFSFLADVAWGQPLLKALTIVLILALIIAFFLIPERFTLLKLAIVLVIAGAIGNLVDRFMFDEVRDFVWLWMIFTEACCNFADFWIVIGVALIVVDMMFLNEWAVFPMTKKAKAAQNEKQEGQENDE